MIITHLNLFCMMTKSKYSALIKTSLGTSHSVLGSIHFTLYLCPMSLNIVYLGAQNVVFEENVYDRVEHLVLTLNVII